MGAIMAVRQAVEQNRRQEQRFWLKSKLKNLCINGIVRACHLQNSEPLQLRTTPRPVPQEDEDALAGVIA